MAKKSYGDWIRSNPALPTKEYQKKHMAQMTAVEWLQEQYDNCPESFLTDDDFNKAKQMQKEQIVNAHLTGLIYPLETDASLQAEEYYNETFKK